jgi:3D (Asp-Asp-Asp) domain-containing protein
VKLALLLLAATLAAGEWVPMEVEATAYCPCKICCGVRGVGITSTGVKTWEEPYGVAVVPRQIPYGTRLFVPGGFGYLDRSRTTESGRTFQADDTGGALHSDSNRTGAVRIDLRFRTHWSARRFGRKTITIYRWVE